MEGTEYESEATFKLFYAAFMILSVCNVHKDFFDEECKDCKAEYANLKGHTSSKTDSGGKSDFNRSSEKIQRIF